MSKIFDSHMHLNINDFNYSENMIKSMKNSNICGGVLIFNTKKELEYFFKDISIWNSMMERIVLSVNLNMIEDSEIKATIQTLIYNGFRVTMKIHSRISKITKEQFATVAKKVGESNLDRIIVDGFPYGHNIEYHTGLELLLYLANMFPEKNFILAHSGGIQILECMLFTRTLSNIYFDLSLTCNYLYNTSKRVDMVQFLKYNCNKIMFGSDFPDFNQCDAIFNVNQLCKEAGLTEVQKARVFLTNAVDIFGLSIDNLLGGI